MGKVAGLLMIVAGVGTAAYVYPMIGSSSDKAEKQLAEIVAITTAAEPKRQPAPVVVKSADTAGSAVTVPSRVISADLPLGRSGLTAAAPVAPATPPVAVAAAPVVTAKPVEAPVPLLVKRPKAEDEGRLVLTRDIQRELKRVGCFQGEADGTWNTSTKLAMKQFIDRVNATLPTDEPDHILKTLVQGHPGNACGKSCPAGQSVSSDGRCLPTAIMTQGPTPVKRPAVTPAEVAAASESPVKTPPAPAAAPAQPKATSAWETSVTAAPAMAAIAAAALAASSSPSDTRPSATKPLPGRMAVGAAAEPAVSAPAPVTAKVAPEQAEPPKTRFVVKPKAPVAKADKPDTREPVEISEKADKSEKVERAEKPEKPSRPSVGAVAGAVAAVERSDPPRRASPPVPRVAIYRAPPPPPRYVGAYSPPPVRQLRPRFGPQIFRQLEANGR